MQPDLHCRTLAAHTLKHFRALSPLTHCMTNDVVQTFTANTLLALGGRGVDTTEAALAALPAAQALARQIDCIVVVTGEIDYVTNGQRTLSIPGGDPLMTRIVGTGCALSAVVAASCALPGAALDNVASACCWMKLAGQAAAERSEGPGSFIPAFLDALYHLDVEAANATN
ncbi:hydroxyethylthiazole kinase [Salmonella enterica]|uniref:hydroxyethylthiazole kinase n=1 Tax=Salmonella enterica TaxID=28901 RepID=UPI00141CBDF2|nr:hydroxyethylthiazole kinase [Salmonella enterica]ELN8571093.1 hydroxyethylthiazole kinase [Salmonella enterica subsp. enterica serovar Infantis]ECB7149460.1 hypothetical protein [Salmonella enterica subsp. enterica serovar Enteritidis]EDN3545740.1 hypothetical protein [Salmonella enterica subsp. enterica serovar Enteritidis]EGX2923780.1 hypothetical protein [Salmonella enterica subsp. enterica serovar Enteritidis]HBJ2366128.1 hydroxyethylthiazole kinase [Salmonella enterica]